MKKHLNKLFLIILFFSCSKVIKAADPCPPDMPDCESSDGGGIEGGGTGGRKVPIDDYAPILIVTAVTIAGVISYRQRQVIKK
ncbi:hypothetical protein [Empedobacter sp. UBA7248]|uniref:hypothetical protein n=1 Tax=Empedobacter sp. UBA7248 TaxID=1946448 RepID=UPI0025C525C2|nr:hypothetical protein [Empedobacter sp. UBA7248]